MSLLLALPNKYNMSFHGNISNASDRIDKKTLENLNSLSYNAHQDEDQDLKAKIKQVMELTNKTLDDAAFALHDADHDVNKAINIILEAESETKFEWKTNVSKKKKLELEKHKLKEVSKPKSISRDTSVKKKAYDKYKTRKNSPEIGENTSSLQISIIKEKDENNRLNVNNNDKGSEKFGSRNFYAKRLLKKPYDKKSDNTNDNLDNKEMGHKPFRTSHSNFTQNRLPNKNYKRFQPPSTTSFSEKNEPLNNNYKKSYVKKDDSDFRIGDDSNVWTNPKIDEWQDDIKQFEMMPVIDTFIPTQFIDQPCVEESNKNQKSIMQLIESAFSINPKDKVLKDNSNKRYTCDLEFLNGGFTSTITDVTDTIKNAIGIKSKEGGEGRSGFVHPNKTPMSISHNSKAVINQATNHSDFEFEITSKNSFITLDRHKLSETSRSPVVIMPDDYVSSIALNFEFGNDFEFGNTDLTQVPSSFEDDNSYEERKGMDESLTEKSAYQKIKTAPGIVNVAKNDEFKRSPPYNSNTQQPTKLTSPSSPPPSSSPSSSSQEGWSSPDSNNLVERSLVPPPTRSADYQTKSILGQSSNSFNNQIIAPLGDPSFTSNNSNYDKTRGESGNLNKSNEQYKQPQALKSTIDHDFGNVHFGDSSTSTNKINQPASASRYGESLNQLLNTAVNVNNTNTAQSSVKSSASLASGTPNFAPLISPQYALGQALGLPYFTTPPVYSYEDLQVLQKLPLGFYDLSSLGLLQQQNQQIGGTSSQQQQQQHNQQLNQVSNTGHQPLATNVGINNNQHNQFLSGSYQPYGSSVGNYAPSQAKLSHNFIAQSQQQQQQSQGFPDISGGSSTFNPPQNVVANQQQQQMNQNQSNPSVTNNSANLLLMNQLMPGMMNSLFIAPPPHPAVAAAAAGAATLSNQNHSALVNALASSTNLVGSGGMGSLQDPVLAAAIAAGMAGNLNVASGSGKSQQENQFDELNSNISASTKQRVFQQTPYTNNYGIFYPGCGSGMLPNSALASYSQLSAFLPAQLQQNLKASQPLYNKEESSLYLNHAGHDISGGEYPFKLTNHGSVGGINNVGYKQPSKQSADHHHVQQQQNPGTPIKNVASAKSQHHHKNASASLNPFDLIAAIQQQQQHQHQMLQSATVSANVAVTSTGAASGLNVMMGAPLLNASHQMMFGSNNTKSYNGSNKFMNAGNLSRNGNSTASGLSLNYGGSSSTGHRGSLDKSAGNVATSSNSATQQHQASKPQISTSFW